MSHIEKITRVIVGISWESSTRLSAVIGERRPILTTQAIYSLRTLMINKKRIESRARRWRWTNRLSVDGLNLQCRLGGGKQCIPVRYTEKWSDTEMLLEIHFTYPMERFRVYRPVAKNSIKPEGSCDIFWSGLTRSEDLDNWSINLFVLERPKIARANYQNHYTASSIQVLSLSDNRVFMSITLQVSLIGLAL